MVNEKLAQIQKEFSLENCVPYMISKSWVDKLIAHFKIQSHFHNQDVISFGIYFQDKLSEFKDFLQLQTLNSYRKEADSVWAKPEFGLEYNSFLCHCSVKYLGVVLTITSVEFFAREVPYTFFVVWVPKGQETIAHSLLFDIVQEEGFAKNMEAKRLGSTGCSWSNVFVSELIRQTLINDLEFWVQNESWFKEKKLPYKRGYLLHGPPGNGKTMCIRTIANVYGLSKFTFDFGNPRVDNSDLKTFFSETSQNAPVLLYFEDIDRVFGENRTNVTFDAFLNCLDGVRSNDGMIVIATANNPKILDDAILKRPGRFDRVIEFPNPNKFLRIQFLTYLFQKSQVSESCLAYLSDNTENFSMASLQSLFEFAGSSAFHKANKNKTIEIEDEDALFAFEQMIALQCGAKRPKERLGFRASASGTKKTTCKTQELPILAKSGNESGAKSKNESGSYIISESIGKLEVNCFSSHSSSPISALGYGGIIGDFPVSFDETLEASPMSFSLALPFPYVENK